MENEGYMELCMHIDGKDNVYLRIPTLWDAVEKQFIGFIKTPQTQRLIYGAGKTSKELQDSFNVCMSKLFHESDELGDEIMGMFMPAFYYEKV